MCCIAWSRIMDCLEVRARMALEPMFQLCSVHLHAANKTLSIPFGDGFCILVLQVPSVCVGHQGRSVPHSPGVQEERSLSV
jgi:hypothetical protein